MRGAPPVLLGLALGAAACTAVLGYERLTQGPGTPGPEASAPDPCRQVPWPARPDAGDGPDIHAIVLALQSFDVDPNHFNGFNLDQQCTCPGPGSCSTVDSAFSSLNPTCDQSDGGDLLLNSALVMVDTIIPAVTPSAIQGVITQGVGNWLLRLTGYNGQANDPKVLVELFVSSGMPAGDAGARPPPRFDGKDTWSILESSLDPSTTDAGTDAGTEAGTETSYRSLYLDNLAYVTDSVLVARPTFPLDQTAPMFGIPLGTVGNGTPLTFPLSDLVLVATLTPASDGAFSLEHGLLGARVPTDGDNGLFAALMQSGFCPSGGTATDYKELLYSVCAVRDIAAHAGSDNTGIACGALSFGAAFVATPAQLGPLTAPPAPSSCDAGVPYCPDPTD